MCKAPVKLSPPTTKTLLLQAGCLGCRPTNSVKALKGNYSLPLVDHFFPAKQLLTFCKYHVAIGQDNSHFSKGAKYQ